MINDLLPTGKTRHASTTANLACRYARAILHKTGDDRELAGKLARMLFVELPESLSLAESALRTQDRGTMLRSVHKINGAASFSGLEGIRESAALLESALIDGESFAILDPLCQDLAGDIESFTTLQQQIFDVLES